MANTQPVLAGTTLPWPSKHTITLGYRGGVNMMADGTQVTDLVQTGAKHTFTLGWVAQTATNLSSILTGVASVKNASGSYTDINGSAYTVTLDGMYEVTSTTINSAGNVYLYSTEIKLREA